MPGETSGTRALVISGSMGAGKTTVLGEASDLLSAQGIPHAVIDLDALGVSGVGDAKAQALTLQNLAAVWGHYRTVGLTHVLIAEAVESAAEREQLREALAGAAMVVCRLKAPLETMQARVRVREPGMLQAEFVARVAVLEATLDAAQVEDFSVENDGRSVTEVAREMLLRTGWIDQGR